MNVDIADMDTQKRVVVTPPVRVYSGPLTLPSRNIWLPPLVPSLLSELRSLIDEGVVVVDGERDMPSPYWTWNLRKYKTEE